MGITVPTFISLGIVLIQMIEMVIGFTLSIDNYVPVISPRKSHEEPLVDLSSL